MNPMRTLTRRKFLKKHRFRNAITERNNTPERIDSSVETEKSVSDCEDRIVKIIQAEHQKIRRNEHRL